CGRYPISPVRSIVPPVGAVSPERVLVRVVLPAPLRPTRPILSPRSTRKETPSIRVRAPTRISRSCTLSTGIVHFYCCRADSGVGGNSPVYFEVARLSVEEGFMGLSHLSLSLGKPTLADRL